MMITFFIFKRPIIAGWGRDMRTILWLIRNLIRICGWRFDRLVDPIKIRFTGSPTLRPITYGWPLVFQVLGAPNQYRAHNLRSSWPYNNTRLHSLKNMTTYQRSMHTSKRSMINFVNLSWTWHHTVVIHVRLLLFGLITTSLLLLLQLHHYVNL